VHTDDSIGPGARLHANRKSNLVSDDAEHGVWRGQFGLPWRLVLLGYARLRHTVTDGGVTTYRRLSAARPGTVTQNSANVSNSSAVAGTQDPGHDSSDVSPTWPTLSPQENRVAVAMIGFIVLVAGVLFIAGIWLTWSQYRRLNGYASVSATVESVDVTVRHDGEGTVTQRPAVRYSYIVDGRTLRSDIVTPFDESRTGDWARRVAAAYRPGERVTAYYDPTRPTQAYLERTVSVLPWALTAGSALWLVIGAALARSAFKGRRRTKSLS